MTGTRRRSPATKRSLKKLLPAISGRHPRFGGDLDQALGAIRARALVMPGETDLYFPPADSAYAVERMPNARLRIIPSVWGHLAGSPTLNPVDAAFVEAGLRELLAENV